MADEGACIGMAEDHVQRLLEVRLRALPRRQHGAVEQPLLVGRVERRPGLHGNAEVAPRAEEAPRIALVLAAERPARERPREGLHHLLVIGRDRLVLGVQAQRAVRVKLVEADREQLQDLAGVVLVGIEPQLGDRLAARRHVEVDPHGGAERHRLQQLAEVAETVLRQEVEIRRQPLRVVAHVGVHVRDHEELGEREGDPLAELVGSLHGLLEKGPPHQPGRLLLTPRHRLVVGREMGGRGHRELLVEPAREALLLKGLHLARPRPVRRLEKETGGVLRAGRTGRQRRRRRGRRKRLAAVRRAEEALDLPRRIGRGVEVQVTLPAPERGEDRRLVIRPGRLDPPHPRPVGLRLRRVDVEQDRAVRAVDVLAADRTGQAGEGEAQHRRGLVLRQDQRRRPRAARRGPGLRRERGEEELAADLGRRRGRRRRWWWRRRRRAEGIDAGDDGARLEALLVRERLERLRGGEPDRTFVDRARLARRAGPVRRVVDRRAGRGGAEPDRDRSRVPPRSRREDRHRRRRPLSPPSSPPSAPAPAPPATAAPRASHRFVVPWYASLLAAPVLQAPLTGGTPRAAIPCGPSCRNLYEIVPRRSAAGSAGIPAGPAARQELKSLATDGGPWRDRNPALKGRNLNSPVLQRRVGGVQSITMERSGVPFEETPRRLWTR